MGVEVNRLEHLFSKVEKIDEILHVFHFQTQNVFLLGIAFRFDQHHALPHIFEVHRTRKSNQETVSPEIVKSVHVDAESFVADQVEDFVFLVFPSILQNVIPILRVDGNLGVFENLLRDFNRKLFVAEMQPVSLREDDFLQSMRKGTMPQVVAKSQKFGFQNRASIEGKLLEAFPLENSADFLKSANGVVESVVRVIFAKEEALGAQLAYLFHPMEVGVLNHYGKLFFGHLGVSLFVDDRVHL